MNNEEIEFNRDFILETAEYYGIKINKKPISKNIIKIIPLRFRSAYNCGIVSKKLKEHPISCLNATSADMNIYNDKILPFIYDNVSKDIYYSFSEDMAFSHLTKIKVSKEVYESMNDRYVYDYRSNNIVAAVFIEEDKYVDYVDKDYSDLSFMDFKMKLSDDLLYVM